MKGDDLTDEELRKFDELALELFKVAFNESRVQLIRRTAELLLYLCNNDVRAAIFALLQAAKGRNYASNRSREI